MDWNTKIDSLIHSSLMMLKVFTRSLSTVDRIELKSSDIVLVERLLRKSKDESPDKEGLFVNKALKAEVWILRNVRH